MDANEFVSQLAALAPPKIRLLELGYREDQAESYRACYVCVLRPTPLIPYRTGDAFFELFSTWDLSSLEIGSLKFHPKLRPFPDHLEIGTFGGDRLVCRPELRDYALLDWQDLTHVMYRIAKDSSSFMAGLLTVAACLSQNSIDEINLDEDANAAEDWTLKCAQTFGGSDAQDFCRSLLGT